MRYLLLILSISLFINSCSEPDTNGPGVVRINDRIVDFRRVNLNDSQFTTDSLLRVVIRSEEELNSFTSQNTQNGFIDQSIKENIDFQEEMIVGIVAHNEMGDIEVKIESIEIINEKLHINFELNETLVDLQDPNTSSDFVVCKKYSEIEYTFDGVFNRDDQTGKYENYAIVAQDLPINTNWSWSTSMKSQRDLEYWLQYYDGVSLGSFNSVNFENEMMICVGLPTFNRGSYELIIEGLKVQNGKLIVYPRFKILNQSQEKLSFKNVFIKLPKTSMDVEFAPLETVKNYNIPEDLYIEKLVEIETGFNTPKTFKYHIKDEKDLETLRNNLPIFENFEVSEGSQTFDLYDLIIIQSESIPYNYYNLEVDKFRLEEDGVRMEFELKVSGRNNQVSKSPLFIFKVFKLNEPISEFNYEIDEE